MENATKALVMAGSVLIAIIVISTLLYAASSWGIIPNAQSENKKIDQIKEFNMEYESYNRQAVYGVDLISVISKAIENNKKYAAANTSDPMYIDIEFELLPSNLGGDVDKITTVWKYYLDGTKVRNEDHSGDVGLYGGKSYSISKNYTPSNDSGEINILISNVENKKKNSINKNRILEDSNKRKYQEFETVQYGGSEFKTRVFACDRVEYNSETGRIKYMFFKQVKVNV